MDAGCRGHAVAVREQWQRDGVVEDEACHLVEQTLPCGLVGRLGRLDQPLVDLRVGELGPGDDRSDGDSVDLAVLQVRCGGVEGTVELQGQIESADLPRERLVVVTGEQVLHQCVLDVFEFHLGSEVLADLRLPRLENVVERVGGNRGQELDLQAGPAGIGAVSVTVAAGPAGSVQQGAGLVDVGGVGVVVSGIEVFAVRGEQAPHSALRCLGDILDQGGFLDKDKTSNRYRLGSAGCLRSDLVPPAPHLSILRGPTELMIDARIPFFVELARVTADEIAAVLL